MNTHFCPLCTAEETLPFHHDGIRDYLICPSCDLVFAHPDSWPDAETELERYELHENDLMDLRYRDFLQKLSKPVLQRIAPHSRGLDFGSGPGPLLKQIFEEQGHVMSIYDAFYAPALDVFKGEYDFITASEVAEHLHQPAFELDRLWSRLKPGGYLGIMTSLRHEQIDFRSWYYTKDDTHVIFFSPQTMKWLAEHWEAKLKIISHSVVVFQKQDCQIPGEDSNPRLV